MSDGLTSLLLSFFAKKVWVKEMGIDAKLTRVRLTLCAKYIGPQFLDI